MGLPAHMAYPRHYTSARRLLSEVQAAVEREREAATGERRALLDEVHERTEAALGSHRLLVDRAYAEQAAAQARADLDALGRLA